MVERDEDFAAAFRRAQAAGTLAVIELRLDPEALTAGATLTEVRAAGEAALRARAAPEQKPAPASVPAPAPAPEPPRGFLGRLFGR